MMVGYTSMSSYVNLFQIFQPAVDAGIGTLTKLDLSVSDQTLINQQLQILDKSYVSCSENAAEKIRVQNVIVSTVTVAGGL